MLLQLHEPGQTPLPHQENRPIVGIDLGTTHSLVAFVKDNDATIVVDKTPSVVAWDNQQYKVGKEALACEKPLFSVKRLMSDPTARHTPLAEPSLTPVQASAEILKYLKTQAEQALGFSIKEIVLTVPAYFDDTARTATRQAARFAGLEVIRMINEPTAAALAYGLKHEAEGLYGVYDLGGGTFDFSILRLEKEVFQVIATGGDTHLGGDDMDHALQTLLPSSLPPEALRSLKEKLTHEVSVSQERTLITRAMLETCALPFVDRTLSLCQEVLTDASLKVQDLKGIVLVGGATRMPLVQKAVEDFFQQKPLTTINPDEAIALGAAYQAHALATGTGTLLLDVCPLSLGIEMMGGTVDKLITRNSPIPLSVTEEFTTSQEGQTAILIHVVQGEREMAADCQSLAQFELRGIPPAPPGWARIEVTFTLDADGLLSVSAYEKNTGLMQSIEITSSCTVSEQAIEAMIQASYENAERDWQEKTKHEMVTQAQRLKNATYTALKQDSDLLSAQESQEIQTGLKVLEEALEGGDITILKEATKALETLTHTFAEKRLNHSLSTAFKGLNLNNL